MLIKLTGTNDRIVLVDESDVKIAERIVDHSDCYTLIIFKSDGDSMNVKETPEQIWNIINGTEEFQIKMNLPKEQWGVSSIKLVRSLIKNLQLKDAKDFVEGNKVLQVTKKVMTDLINNFGKDVIKAC